MRSLQEIFGAAVRRHRERLGLSQEAFAERAGIHRTYASSVERGKVQVSIVIAQKLAETLRVRLSDLWKEVEEELGDPDSPPSS